MKTLVFSLFILLSTHLLLAQSGAIFMFPAEYGSIEYEYSGNTEGSRVLYFEESGKRIALYTDLERTSTFYSVRSTTRENVVEYLRDGFHYHFDLELKKAQILSNSLKLLRKHIHFPADFAGYEDLGEVGATYLGKDLILEKETDHWIYRNKEFWIWKGLLMKLESTGLNKNFSIIVKNIDLDNKPDVSKFNFPEGIEIPVSDQRR